MRILLVLFLSLLWSLSTSSGSTIGDECPDGSEAIEGYFSYYITLYDFMNNCGQRGLYKIDRMIDEIVIRVETMYPAFTGGGEIDISTCESEFVKSGRSLRSYDSSHRSLGRYSRGGGGYCRHCPGNRRELQTREELAAKEDAITSEVKTLEEVNADLENQLVDEQQLIEADSLPVLTKAQVYELQRWLEGFEKAVADQVHKELQHAWCVKSISSVEVDIKLVNDPNELPC